jgi:hypothetical protein
MVQPKWRKVFSEISSPAKNAVASARRQAGTRHMNGHRKGRETKVEGEAWIFGMVPRLRLSFSSISQ